MSAVPPSSPLSPSVRLPDRADVVVVGGGLAALCAALAARQAGAGVLLLEQAGPALRGGNTRHSRNLRLTHDAPGPLMPGSYRAEEFIADLRRASKGDGDPALHALLATESVRLADWLTRCGVRFQTEHLPYSRKTAFFLGGGKAAVNSLYATAARSGIDVRLHAGVVAVDPLPSSYGSSSGLSSGPLRVVLDSGAAVQAGAVVVACGGYQANPDWLAAEWGPLAATLHNRGTPHADGQVLRHLLQAGAQPSGAPGRGHLVAVDGRSPRHDGGIVTRVDGFGCGRVIDAAGTLLTPPGETGPPRYSAWGRRVAAGAGGRAVLVVEARRAAELPMRVYPPLPCATAAEAAALAGIPPQAMEAALSGLEPPFLLVPVHPGLTFTGLGLTVDPALRVQRADGGHWPGLYAAGMIIAPQILGSGYVAGAALTVSAVTGRRAGEEAARYVRS